MFNVSCLVLVRTLVFLVVHMKMMDAVKPYGVKMCINLCSHFGNCDAAIYYVHELNCCVNSCNKTIFNGAGLYLDVPEEDRNGTFYRKIISKLKGTVFIKSLTAEKERTAIKTTDIPIDKYNRSTLSKGDGYEKVSYSNKAVRMKFFKEKVIWSAAQNACESENARLLKAEGNKKLQQMPIKFIATFITGVQWWIGLKFETKTEQFIWTDGHPLLKAKWQPGQPKHYGLDSNEDVIETNCVILLKFKYGGLVFDDVDCQLEKGYICEKPVCSAAENNCTFD